MNNRISLENLLAGATNKHQRLVSFALLGLGMTESLASGTVGASDAIGLFFHAENCQYVRDRLKGTGADRLMGHGTQLPDLFDALPPSGAQREFQRELAAMRALCLKLLQSRRAAA